jgi:carbon-monoxide dehydrogenase small subunit
VIVNGAAGHVDSRLLLSDSSTNWPDRHPRRARRVRCLHGLLDGEAIRSCLMFAVQADGHAITTVEGLSADPLHLHSLQQAFWDAHGLQCGFCTPGILMTMIPFLAENPHPTEIDIRKALSGNLCRCTGYQHIVDAVKLAAERRAPSG